MATLTMADVYGVASKAGSAVMGTPGGTSVQATGPNPSSVTTGANTAGGAPMAAGNGAAFCWVGAAIALVLMRVVIEAGGKVETP